MAKRAQGKREKGEDGADGADGADGVGSTRRGTGKGGPPLYFDDGRRAIFLSALHECCHVGSAAATAGVSSGTVYSHRNRDAGFKAAMEEAMADGAARVRQEMLDREIDATGLGPVKDSIGRTSGWLSSRLRAIEGEAAARPRRALPRAEMERLLLEHIERLSRRLERSTTPGREG